MKLALYIKKTSLKDRPEYKSMCEDLLSDGFEIVEIQAGDELPSGTDLVLSIGGDGTFLCSAKLAALNGVPVAGVNFGRMGFLSEFRPGDVSAILREGKCFVEDEDLLEVISGSFKSLALNEVAVLRSGAGMLGVDVSLDGVELPTYWADGLLVSTSAGSTAYSLSAGGPICTPETKVLIIAPIAPHNLNVRPLIVPSTTKLELGFHSREATVNIACDTTACTIPAESKVSISVAQFSLKRLRLSKANFIEALRSKLYWGEDIRNEAK